MKKTKNGLPNLELAENPDILAGLSDMKEQRPHLLIGFAAETEHVIEHAKKKLKKKGCDWIVANDVSAQGNVFGNDETSIHIISSDKVDSFENVSKEEAARQVLIKAAKVVKQ